MRLALSVAVLVVAVGPAFAASGKCMAHSHKGAIPYDLDTSNPTPADTSRGDGRAADSDAEVAGIDRDANGQEWVYRVHEFAWKRRDVDLLGDCRRARS